MTSRLDAEADLSNRAYSDLCDWLQRSGSKIEVQGEIYSLPDDKLYDKLADGQDELYLERKSDGKIFQAEVDVSLYEVERPDGEGSGG
jgi:hypothetical protein